MARPRRFTTKRKPLASMDSLGAGRVISETQFAIVRQRLTALHVGLRSSLGGFCTIIAVSERLGPPIASRPGGLAPGMSDWVVDLCRQPRLFAWLNDLFLMAEQNLHSG